MATNNIVNTPLVGSTGTGAFAGSNSAVFVTPNIGAATGTSINFGGSTFNSYSEFITYTPVLTFTTPGDLSVSYSTQLGHYTRTGNVVIALTQIVCTPTYTTASGDLIITGYPFASNATPTTYATCGLDAATTLPAGRTYVIGTMAPSSTQVKIAASGSATALANLTTTNVVSGAAFGFKVIMIYFV